MVIANTITDDCETMKEHKGKLVIVWPRRKQQQEEKIDWQSGGDPDLNSLVILVKLVMHPI